MGWYSSTSRHFWGVVDDLVRAESVDFRVVGCETDAELWQLYRSRDGELVILVDLIEWRDGAFWNKPLSEIEGPYYYGCPVEWFERAPVKNQKWRDKVIANQDQRKVNVLCK